MSDRLDKLIKPSDLRKTDEALHRAALAKVASHQGLSFDVTRADNDGQIVEFHISLNGEAIHVRWGDRVIVVAGVELPIDELATEVRRELEAAMARLDGASFDVDANLLGVQEARRAIEWAIFGVMSSKPYRDRLITAGTRRVKTADVQEPTHT